MIISTRVVQKTETSPMLALTKLSEDLTLRGYETSFKAEKNGHTLIVTKGRLLRKAVGQKMSFTVSVAEFGDKLRLQAGVHFLKTQTLPSLISAVIYPPLVIAQGIGLIRNLYLDVEALNALEEYLR